MIPVNALLAVIITCSLFTLGSSKFSCPDGEFECNITETCIPNRWKCDGENDCSDGRDEKDCVKVITCPPDYYKCRSGRCIKNSWLCDTHADCPDGDDEAPKRNCTRINCRTTDFQCANGDCIPGSFKCDNDKDCEDGSDELRCPGLVCDDNKFRCADNTSCISKGLICNGQIDCIDGSDERNCSSCSGSRFQCKNKECVTIAWRCDGDNDCADKSDEDGCSQHPTPKSCAGDKFQCSDASCIPKHWKCDGEPDCSDSSDEHGCPTFTTCSSEQFTCNTGQCVPMIAKCNGKDECPDGSDEHGCAATPTSPCQENMFRCGQSSVCIDKNKVCNHKRDCPGGEDESLSCNINECADHNGHCHHQCIDLPVGYKCSCDNGFMLSNDSRACEDINECEQYGTCSQTCVNSKGSYKCGCADGYVKEILFNTCKAKGPRHYLIFGDGHSVCNISTAGTQHHFIASNLKAPMAVDYDIQGGYIYWSDILDEKIQRNSILGGGEVETIVDNVKHANGLAVDWVGGNLYWTDESSKTIEVSLLNGQHRLTLFTVNNGNPRGIAVDPFKRLIFWTDWNSVRPKIERASMDGNSVSRQVIIDTNIVWPTAIALDPITQRVYFADSKLKKIETCKYDGSSRTEILSSGLLDPFSLSVFEDRLYCTDHSLGTIFSVNKLTGYVHGSLIDKLDRLTGITVVQPLRQKKVDSACDVNNGGCSHLCLLSTNVKKYSCRCPEGMHLHSDGKSCKRIIVSPTKIPDSEKDQPTRKKTTCTDNNGDCSHFCKVSSGQTTCYCPKSMTLDNDGKTCARLPGTPTTTSTSKSGPVNAVSFSKKSSSNKGPLIAGVTVAVLFVIFAAFVGVLYWRKRVSFRDRTILFYKDNSRVPLQNDFDEDPIKTPEEIGSRSRVQFA